MAGRADSVLRCTDICITRGFCIRRTVGRLLGEPRIVVVGTIDDHGATHRVVADAAEFFAKNFEAPLNRGCKPEERVHAGHQVHLYAELGHGEVVHILRRASSGLNDQLTISLDDLLVRADPAVNIPIFSNDVISVPMAAPVTIYLMGEVGTTGAMTFRASQRPTLLTAIAQAGGLDRFARGEAIQIRRTDASGRETIFPFDFGELEAGRALSANIRLMDGDVIFVPERGLFD
mgnify:CR=1 FL=1